MMRCSGRILCGHGRGGAVMKLGRASAFSGGITAAEYGWIDDAMGGAAAGFSAGGPEAAAGCERIDGSIAVQARQTLEETEGLLELAEANAFIRGVVGWVDLCSPDVRSDLERPGGAEKAARGAAGAGGAGPGIYAARGFSTRDQSARRIWAGVRSAALSEAPGGGGAGLVRAFPWQRFVLDHIAKPVIRAGLLEPWARDMRALAKHENVTCKLSGMVTEARWGARWGRWTPADFAPYLDVVLEAFGADRVMIGSDWPVCHGGARTMRRRWAWWPTISCG